jgi:malate synthase
MMPFLKMLCLMCSTLLEQWLRHGAILDGEQAPVRVTRELVDRILREEVALVERQVRGFEKDPELERKVVFAPSCPSWCRILTYE